ncbi:MAG: RNA polymerase factor sigma-54 [Schleiferiaceae bacterium]|jgi:RNA polymerase sigma-54 factor|nr:RNA polymerase factor sigma-54 [Bacteroidota bacterium]MCO4774993.1 RNA polymerase factor sigma-54 [Flavobacteriales bacterium]MDA7722315.1 RNA polymerase factor sigma-54 [Schleiferiaceae bacterium]MBT6365705.1 RNA polymerase factor sigma-54 [Bacteroidota bacterium]MCH9810034.1 RNA polymerase factor sigma-54 [Bacteroidota bacterium]
MLKQNLSQKLQQKLSPQQIQLMKLVQLQTQSLEARIKQEIEENPALQEGKEKAEDNFENDASDEREVRDSMEEINWDDYLGDDETPDYRTKANNYSSDDEMYEAPVLVNESFHDSLISQLRLRDLSSEELELVVYLVGTIDDDGLLRRDLIDIVDDLAFSQGVFTEEKELERLLEIIQDLDPPGVGGRDLRECLMLQLERKRPSFKVNLALSILDNHFDSFVKRHYQKLMDRLGVNEDELRDAIEEIGRLNPKPGGSSNLSRPTENVIPDYNLQIVDDELELTLNGRNAPELSLSRQYRDMLEHYKASKEKNKAEKEAALFVKQKLDSAKWFIDAIVQRQQTLMLTMQSILNYQRDYFLTGDERKLRPMILKDIAEEIGMDISTVSRVASNKYIQTPYGTFLIKRFFSESMTNSDGEEVSTREIKKILEDTVAEEDKRKPMTDDALAKILKEKGYPIARRTVAKYREQLDIPVARMRKEL